LPRVCPESTWWAAGLTPGDTGAELVPGDVGAGRRCSRVKAWLMQRLGRRGWIGCIAARLSVRFGCLCLGFAWGGLPCRGGFTMLVSWGLHFSIRVVLCQGESGSGASLGARDGLVPDVMMSHGVLDAGLSRCVDACLTGWSVPYGMG